MARPTTLDDITPGTVIIATIHLDAISLDPVMLKGYTDLLAAATKSGSCTVENRYNTVTFARDKNAEELADQLRAEQSSWDHNRRQYLRWANGEAFDYPYMFSLAKKFAADEDMPTFPWDAEGRMDDHTVDGYL